jgi:hypothetical protein
VSIAVLLMDAGAVVDAGAAAASADLGQLTVRSFGSSTGDVEVRGAVVLGLARAAG